MTAAGDYSLILTHERSADEVDLAALVESYGPLLFRVAHSVVRDRQEAEDVVQDTFVRVVEHRRSLPGVRDMRVWLIRIAWNLAIDRRRKVRADQMDPQFTETLAANELPADQALAGAQSLRSLMVAIDALPKPERQALLLSAVDELSMAEVAGVIGRSESATRAIIFRARTRLKKRMKGGTA